MELIIPKEEASPHCAYDDLVCDRQVRGEHPDFAPTFIEGASSYPWEGRNFSWVRPQGCNLRPFLQRLDSQVRSLADLLTQPYPRSGPAYNSGPQHFLGNSTSLGPLSASVPSGIFWSPFALLAYLLTDKTFIDFFQKSTCQVFILSWGVSLLSPAKC